jgi:eukaryotic-like serine/threonine-protein kinase
LIQAPMTIPISATERALYSYRFGSAEFNEARFELKVAGLVVDVERRALEVLAYLLAHAGEVVTKEELFREVWAGRLTVDKVLPNAINKLRRALGESNAAFVSTQARLGYRLDGVVNRTAVGQPLRSSIALAVGLPVPGREQFLLKQQFSHHRGSEVWCAQHQHSKEQRVYKFANDAERLRSLKREATLSRVLQESAQYHQHFVEIIDWNFETAPYFLECAYGGQNLQDWAQTELDALDQEQRVAIFLQIADAVASAHAVGVLHKDLKPANVLIEALAASPDSSTSSDRPRADWQVRITDFGSGRLIDPERRDALGIARMGLTVTQNITTDSSSGTPLYIAPEIFDGQTPTVQSDIYALGIILYQLLVGQLHRPMVSGWEQDIVDEFLRDDLRLATDGNPARRLSSVAELAARLRDRDRRRNDAELLSQAQIQAQSAQAALARERARKPFAIALFAALAVGLLTAVFLHLAAVKARNQAQSELARANALNQFLNEDLIGRANPLVLAKGQNAELKDLLLAARDRIADRYTAQPLTEATLRANLASFFNTIDLWPEALAQAQRALALFESEQGQQHLDALKTRALLARLQCRLGKFDDAEQTLQSLDKLATGDDPQLVYLRNAALSTYSLTRGDMAKAIVQLQAAIAALDAIEKVGAQDAKTAPMASTQKLLIQDSLRLELIAAQTLAGHHQQAIDEGNALIDESLRRKDANGLIAALVKKAMARSYSMLGDHAKAETLLLDAQTVVIAQLGENHSHNISLLTELLGIAFRTADYQKALKYAELVHLRARAKFGDQHNMTYVSLVNWSRVEYELGQFQQAQKHLREAHQYLSKNLGVKAPQTQDAAFVLIGAEIALKQFDAAQVLIDELDVEVLEATRGTGLWPKAIEGFQGMLLHTKGDRKAAEGLLRSARAALKPASADEPVDRMFIEIDRMLATYQNKAK